MSKWRERYNVHPAADVFPMMTDAELQALGEDIKANGQTIPILFWRGGGKLFLIDGRNRLEAMERHCDGMEPLCETFTCKDPVTHIITLNIRRRHLTKAQQADLIVAAIKAGAEASRQLGEVPKRRHVKGKAGSEKDATKAAIVATAEEHGIKKRTVERAMAKAEGKKPKLPRRRTKEEIARERFLTALAMLEPLLRHLNGHLERGDVPHLPG